MAAGTELLFRDDAYLQRCPARAVAADDRGIRLDRTVFYPTGGGQPGDRGALRLSDGRLIPIVDTRKGDTPDEVLHLVEPGTALPSPGEPVEAEIDWDYRYRLMRCTPACICSVLSCPARSPADRSPTARRGSISTCRAMRWTRIGSNRS